MEYRSHSLQSLLADESFHRWINGKSNRQETDHWEQWVHASEENLVIAEKAKHILRELSIVSGHQKTEQDAMKQWDRLEKRIENDDSGSLMFPFETRKQNRRWQSAFRYAAVIAILMLSGYAFWQYRLNNHPKTEKVAMLQLDTQYGEQKIIKLSDGSQIHLAPHSHLRYASDWLNQPVRKLYLDGEAYFDIVGTRKPGHAEFEIHTRDGVIHDLGTQFNVSTFHNQTSVVLKKGVVTVHSNMENNNNEVRLAPGQMVTIGRNLPNARIEQVNPEVYTSWSTNLLVFDHTPLRQFIQTLKDLYGVNVVVKDSVLLNRELTGNIEKQSLGTILRAVSKVLNINIYQRGHTVFIDN